MEKTDWELIKDIKEKKNLKDNLETLYQRHSGAYFHIINNYKPFVNSVDGEFFEDSKESMFYQTILKFDPDKKAKFSTFLMNQTKYFCLNTINRNKRACVDEDFFEEEEEKSENPLDKIELHDIIDLADHYYDERLARIMFYRFKDAEIHSWREVSQNLKNEGISLSHEGCKLIYNKFIEYAKTN